MWKDGNLWMLTNPGDGGQNTERILKLWTPLIESFKKAARAAFRKKKAAFRKKNRPMLTALYCSFSKAHQLATSLHDPSQELTLWAAMASVPTSLIHNIAVQAELVFVEHITPQSRPG